MNILSTWEEGMKLDLYKTCKAEYAAPRQPLILQVKPAQYLGLEGQSEPGGEAFVAGIGALMNVAFTVKMARKRAGKEYAVCKLECGWSNLQAARSQWKWELLIRTPDFINAKDLQAAGAKLAAKGPLIAQVHLIKLEEGSCVQMLHVGPYDKIGETQAQIDKFAAENHLRAAGRVHEVYLSDPRRVAAAKLRTILRLPVK
jgi:hypothetical protein